MNAIVAVLLPLALLRPLPRQEENATPPAAEPGAPLPANVPTGTDTAAAALWARVCAASGGTAEGPLEAFGLQAKVRSRTGVQSNDLEVDYAYLAPDCIRFKLTSSSETGRYGPAQEQYWLSSSDGVVTLAGREYKEDRKAVDDMLALARNFAALSRLDGLRLQKLEVIEAPDLASGMRKLERELTWLALESPDFALVRREKRGDDTVYRVELGLREGGLPAVAVIRDRALPGTDPLLVTFDDYRSQEGFHLPFELKVHVLDPSLDPVAFARVPSQEVYVSKASLRPVFQVEDFVPARPR